MKRSKSGVCLVLVRAVMIIVVVAIYAGTVKIRKNIAQESHRENTTITMK